MPDDVLGTLEGVREVLARAEVALRAGEWDRRTENRVRFAAGRVLQAAEWLESVLDQAAAGRRPAVGA